MQADDDWEIWIHQPGHADNVAEHVLVASDLDQQCASSLLNKVNRLVITGQAPDVVLYMRRPFDFTYRVKRNGKTTRVRFTRDSAKDIFEHYKRTFTQPRYSKYWQCKLVQVNNIHARDMRPDMSFLPQVLRNDPVYGEHPLILRDPGPLYFGEPITMEYVRAIMATVDAKKIARIMAAIFIACKSRRPAPGSKAKMLGPRPRRKRPAKPI
mgnify:FL=1